MGCSDSRESSRKNFQSNPSSPQESSSRKSSKPLTDSEIQQRIEAPNEHHTIELDGITYRYAWVSQRGYYPEDADKDNQDSYKIFPNFGKESDQAFFGIFDGHGKDGHHCSRYVRDKLHKKISEKLDRLMGNATSKQIKQALTSAHLIVNDAEFNDDLSGTTSISILFRGRQMFISNVGDSRAIIVSKVTDNDGSNLRLLAQPMSSDQTPYRKDERERIKRYGARILTMDQIEGNEPVHENWGDLNLGDEIDEGGDPPRVWSANGDYPGTAFTRSLGDKYAEECGVTADPEINEREVQETDKYIVIASDGAFEFLTNQMVADLISQHRSDPLAACKAVVAASYNMWLQYEVRTDDITIIVLVVNPTDAADESPLDINLPTSSNLAVDPCHADNANDAISTPFKIQDARPVRRVMSKERRKHMIQMNSEEDNEADPDFNMEDLVIPKLDNDFKTILSAIKSNFLFHHLSMAQLQAVIGVMIPVEVRAGDRVIRQGDQGDRFYVVDSGRYEVRVKQSTGNDSSSFLNRSKSQNFNASKDNSETKISEQKDNLQNSRDEIRPTELSSTIDPILVTPQPSLSIDESEGAVVHIYEASAEQHPGFGELSLMYGKPRAATVIALTDGKLWALDRKVFKRVVKKPKDSRKDILRTLRKVELLKSLNTQQLQRLTDLMNEHSYSAGDHIIRQGEEGEQFYLIVNGKCSCFKTDNPGKILIELTDNDYFGERALLKSEPRAANVVALTDVKVFCIGKRAFEEVLGPLSAIIDEDRLRREAVALAKQDADALIPKQFSDMKLIDVLSVDNMGPLLLGSFGMVQQPADSVHHLTIRSLILSDIEQNSLKNSALRYFEAIKVMTLAKATKPCPFIPQLITTLHEPNALHIVLSNPVVTDLISLVRSNPRDFASNNDNVLIYTISCLVCGLEALHESNILYRAIQPESVYIDFQGKISLMDFKVCKLGLSFHSSAAAAKTFTLCGAADYLAPEQISQTGHSFPVDLWALGVLLYEITMGSHPFSASSEVATYAKISSFGSKSFPTLNFPDDIHSDLKSLINQLLMPIPEARIGALTSLNNSATAGNGSSGNLSHCSLPTNPEHSTDTIHTGCFIALKRHPFFKMASNGLATSGSHTLENFWKQISGGSGTPVLLSKFVENELLEATNEENDIKQWESNFSKPFHGDKSWLDAFEL